MPYKRNADLPDKVRSALPEEAQTIFRKAYNSTSAANSDYSEARLFRIGWGAVRKAGWHEPDEDDEKKKWSRDEDADDHDDDIDPPRRKKPLAFGVDSVGDQIEMRERVLLDANARIRRTDDGYLVALPRIARTGIQIYKGKELGRPELGDVRVYRPPGEVFAADSLRSYTHRPMTNDHPPTLVNSDNWKKYAIGQTGDEVMRDGDFIRVPLLLMDARAIKAVTDGKTELSLGYTMELDWGSGKTPDGAAYDAVQTNIRANHLALVAAARGGPALNIGDDEAGDIDMTLKTITVDELQVEVTDMAAKVIQRHIDALNKQIDALKAKMKEDEGETKKSKDSVATLTAENATLKKQLDEAKVTPAQLDALVKDRAAVAVKAKALIGDKLTIDGKSVGDMRRQVVSIKLGDVCKDWSDDQVTASFNTLAADIKDTTGNGHDPLAVALGSGPAHSSGDARAKAYAEYDKAIGDAWKGTGQARQ